MKVNKKFGEKICKKCGIKKPISEFRKHAPCPSNKYGSSWVDGSCKDCVRKYKRETRAKWRKKNLEKNRRDLKNWALIRTYGINLDDYNKMFEKQQGCCAICGVHNSELKHPLGVDHNHLSKKIRGLLCTNCNSAIGKLKVDYGINLLQDSIKYLKKTDNLK